MYYHHYRRNSDEDLRDIERQLYAGDVTALPRLVTYLLRTNTLTLTFFLDYPQSFHYLPPEMQNKFHQLGLQPPPLQFGDVCPTCLLDDHGVCPLYSGCPCCEETAEGSGLPLQPLPAIIPQQAAQQPEDEDEDDSYQCTNCGHIVDEEVTCENIVDDEGNECGNDICPNCGQLCPECETWLCHECAVTPQALASRTGRHRCSASAEGCTGCGKELFMQDWTETWVFIGEEASEYLENQGYGSADTGTIHCKECLEQYGYDNIADATEGGQVPEED